MASSSFNQFGAPYYGPHHGHNSSGEPRQSRIGASGPQITSFPTDASFVTYPHPIMAAPRDRANTGRQRRARPSTSENRRMPEVSTAQGVATARHTTYRRRSSPQQVWFVPDPPSWDSPAAETQRARSTIGIAGNPPDQASMFDDRSLAVDSHRTRVPQMSRSQYDGGSSAASDEGLPPLPPTPMIPRLRTPDIKPYDDPRPFCDCCPEFERETDSRRKMELQCKLRLVVASLHLIGQ